MQTTTPTSTSLAGAADLYLEQLAPATRRAWRPSLAALVQAGAAAGVDSLEGVQPQQVAAALGALPPAAPSVAEQRREALRAFFAAWMRAGVLERTPTGLLPLQRCPRPLLREDPLTAAGVAALVAAAEARSPRDAALAHLLATTGARIGELCGARVTDWEGGWLLLRGKTGARRVPVTESTRAALLRHLVTRRPRAVGTGWSAPSEVGERCPSPPLESVTAA